MERQTELEALFKKNGFTDYRWINPADVVVSQWVRMKCMYGCSDYGHNASCPPNVPSVAECRQFFDEFSTGVMFHFEKKVKKPEDRQGWARKINKDLSKVERQVFLAGYQKAFLLFMDCCRLCGECAGTRDQCQKPTVARPAAEAMAVDVFATAHKHGYPIEVLTDYDNTMNRYAILLIE